LSADLQAALTDGRRQPAYRLLAFDPSLDNITAVVTGTCTQTPLDLTPFASDISWSPAQLGFTLQDPTGAFHPDTGAQKQYLANKAIIRLVEGDARVPEADWQNSFTGFIQGQIGWTVDRASQVLEAKVTAFSRDNNQALKRRLISTHTYTIGTDLGIILHDVAKAFLGITDPENRIPTSLGMQTLFQTTQLSQMAPWDAITKILETVGRVPFIDGDGRLTSYSKRMQREPDRIFDDYRQIYDYAIQENNADVYNRIKITFIDANLSKVEGTDQKLGEAQVTSGFFSMGEKLHCWWSDDHTQRAENTRLVVKKSINSGLLPVGRESYHQEDDFHGTITISIEVWVPILATLMIMEYLAAAAIPDDVVTFGMFAEDGITIPIGRVLQAQASVAIMLIMMSIGSAQYEVWGTPFDYAYVEKYSIATEDGLAYWEQNQKEIKNDLLGSYDRADYLAITELIWEKSSVCTRKLSIMDDLALELGDIVQLPDGRKFLITDMAKSIKRGEIPVLVLTGIKVLKA
jgi:hypothetical protein